MTQRSKVVNARDVRMGFGFNGIPMSSTGAATGAAFLDKLNCRWLRWGTETGDTTGAQMPNLSSAMQNASIFDPNPRVLWLVDGYWQDRNSYPWSSQQNDILTAMGRKMPNGDPFVQIIEGPNEYGNASLGGDGTCAGGGGSVTVDGGTHICGNDNVDACDTASARSGYVGWATAMHTWMSNNSSAFSKTALAAPTILDGELSAPANSIPGNYPANAPNGINCTGLITYGNHHWYGGTGYASSPCGPDNNSGSGNTKTRLDYDYDGFLHGESGNNDNFPLICSEVGAAWSEGTRDSNGNLTSDANYFASDTVSMGWFVMAIFLDYMAMGGKRVFFYTATGNANKSSDSKGFTGFNYFANGDPNQPTCAAIFLANMMTLASLNNNYKDNSNLSDSNSFTPAYTGTNFSVSGNTKPSASGSYLIMPKSDGSTMIAVWREPFFQFNQGGSTSTLPSSDSITVNFGSNFSGKIWDPTGGSGGNNLTYSSSPTQISTFSNVASVSFNMYAAPVFIEISGQVATSAPAQPTGVSMSNTTSTRSTISWTQTVTNS